MTPENMGVARLVPPTTPTLSWPPMVSMNSAPVNGSASMEMSGTIRAVPVRLDWNAGFANVRLAPPPAPKTKPSFSGGTTGVLPWEMRLTMRVSFVPHPVWNMIELSGLSARLVPPIPVANGELAGKSTLRKPTVLNSSPRSPEAKLTSMPWTAAISRIRFTRSSVRGLPIPSIEDQLFEMVFPR